MTENIDATQAELLDLRAEVGRLKAVNHIALQLGITLDFNSFMGELTTAIIQFVGCERAIVLLPDNHETSLKFGATNYRLADQSKQTALENLTVSLYPNEEDSLISHWLKGEPVLIQPITETNHPSYQWLLETLETQHCYSSPLMVENQLVGVIVIDNPTNANTPVTEAQCEFLESISESAAIALNNARQHQKTVVELADNMREMYILRQIDRELNDTIDLTHVFEMTLDWALRFTNAQTASLAFYDQETDELRAMVDYGYDITPEQVAIIRTEGGGGITQRVARSGYAEVVPDVAVDADFVRIATNTRSQLSVPVMREDRVIAVITLESKKLNGFTDNHLDFVAKLATRAGVAIDNARLYEEAIREREKLSHILSNTADIVVVVGMDDRVMLINQSALAAMRLYPHENYVGRSIFDTFENEILLDAYRRANQPMRA